MLKYILIYVKKYLIDVKIYIFYNTFYIHSKEIY